MFTNSEILSVANFLATPEGKEFFRNDKAECVNSGLPVDTSNAFALKSVFSRVIGNKATHLDGWSGLVDFFQWSKIARTVKPEKIADYLLECLGFMDWITPEDFSDYIETEGSMGEILIIDCDCGEADISFREGQRWHIERGEELGYIPNFDPGAIRIAVAGGDAEINTRLTVDTDDDYIFFSYSLGSGIDSREELLGRFDQSWGRIGHILNQLDPGTFGSQYLFELDGMNTPNTNFEGNN